MTRFPLAKVFVVGDPRTPPTFVKQTTVSCVSQVEQSLKFRSLAASPELSGKRLLKTTNEAVILGRVEVLQEFSCRYDPYAVLSSLVHLI